MTPNTLDNLLGLAAGIIRLVSMFTKWKGDDKLASELEKVAADTDAFRTAPVMKEEIDSKLLRHTWGSPPAPPE